MFEHLFTQAASSGAPHPLPAGEKIEEKPRQIVLHYEEQDAKLLSGIESHFTMLTFRLERQVCWSAWRYPLNKPEEDKTAQFCHILQDAVLFLPCVSPSYMVKLWKQIEGLPRLQETLRQPQLLVCPLPVRPLANMSTTLLPQPLCAYPEGYQREEAFAQIAATLERLLVKHLKQEHGRMQPSPLHRLIQARGLLKAPRGE
jgi:hypothetical protein